MNLNKNIKQLSCAKVPNLMVLCKHYFAYLIQVKNLTLKSFQLCLFVIFLIEVTFLSQMSTFSRNFNHHWWSREQKKKFQTILVIIFCNFTRFQYRSDSPQVKKILISSISTDPISPKVKKNNLISSIPNKLLNNLRLRILGNQEILEKSQI